MKNLQTLLLLAAAAFFAAGCVNEDPAYKKEKPVEPTADNGFLALAGMEMRVIVDDKTDTQPDDTDGETQRPSSTNATRAVPDVDGFMVELFDATDASVLKKTYGELKVEMKDQPLTLPVGNYRMEVRSEETIPDVAWEHPCYGATTHISIRKNETTQIDEIICTLSNIKVTLMCSADLAAKLDQAATKATVSLGGIATDFTLGETRAAYFRAQEPTNTLDFVLDGQFTDGGNAGFSKSIPNVKAGQWRKITLVIAYADKGEIKFDIKVENFIQDEEIVVDGSADAWEAIYEEEPLIDPTAPAIAWPGHDLSEPVQLTEQLSGQAGYFVFDLASPNGIRSFVVSISSDNTQFMESMTGMLIPSEFDLCTMDPDHPAYKWLHDTFKFPMGDELLGATSKRFDISAQMPLLYNFEGTHTFAFRMTDANTLTTEAKLTLIVDKQQGAGPAIVWEGHDLTQVNVLEPDMNIAVDITAAAGIKSLLVTIDSEALRPLLEATNLPILLGQFDLCTIDTDDPDAADFLRDPVGFKVGAEVKGQTSTRFEISSLFCNILLNDTPVLVEGEPNLYNFRIEVIDNKGNSAKTVLQLRQPDTQL